METKINAPAGISGGGTRNLIDELEKVYSSHPDDFAQERHIYEDLLPLLVRKLGDGYELKHPLAMGSTATVWEVTDKNLGVPRALKLARPRLSKIKDIITVVRAEPMKLAALTHNNIIKVYGSGEVDVTIDSENYAFPYFLMEFFADIKDLDQYILANLGHLTGDGIVLFFRDLLSGISYLHEHHIIHCDIKPGNLLVADGRALVADLGYSKQHLPRPEAEDQRLTHVNYTPRYSHPELNRAVIDSADSNANVAEIPQSRLSPAFDLFAFGRSMQDVLVEIRAAERKDPAKQFGRQSVLNPYQWRYLNFVSKRLLDGIVERVGSASGSDDLSSDLIPALSGAVMGEIKYTDADGAVESLEKLLHLYDLEGIIPELNPNLSTYIQIPGARVPLTARVRAIINHPTFSHLIQTTQLGFVSFVYPGASHNRFEHALGTFVRCCDYVRALWYDQVNCLFQMIMSREDIEAILLAALLHDIGQYPMAHDLTEASKSFRHEGFTEYALGVGASTRGPMADVISNDWHLDPGNVLAVLGTASHRPLTFRQRLLHSIISGPLDCDKLDYLVRDCVHLGLTFGCGIDPERLLRNVTIVYSSALERTSGQDGREFDVRQLKVAELGVMERALVVANSLWRTRRDMFTQVYWHHTVRSLKAMLSYAARGILIRLAGDEKERFWYEFQRFLLDPSTFVVNSANVAMVTPPTAFFDFESEDSAMAPAYGSRLAPGDHALLNFLGKFAEGGERTVLEAIQSRGFYLRAAIISAAHEEAKYDAIYGRFKTYYDDDNLAEIERVRSIWETEVIARAQARDEELIASLQRDDKTNAGAPILLVDVPVKGSSRAKTPEVLWYVPEDFTGVHALEPSALPRFAESRLELEQVAFDKSVGKIRILVHPAWRNAIVQNVPEKDLIDIFLEI